jgi:hypothetical protein
MRNFFKIILDIAYFVIHNIPSKIYKEYSYEI